MMYLLAWEAFHSIPICVEEICVRETPPAFQPELLDALLVIVLPLCERVDAMPVNWIVSPLFGAGVVAYPVASTHLIELRLAPESWNEQSA
jgi:hypothetical protein